MGLVVCERNHWPIAYENNRAGACYMCPLCAAKDEIAAHEKENAELVKDINAKIQKIVIMEHTIRAQKTNAETPF